jgi:ParB-like nuclease domain
MRTVPFGEIHLEHHNWKNPRQFTGLSDKELDELAADIKSVRSQSDDKKASGIIDPPKVVMVRQNGSHITLAVDGQRRLLAGARAGLSKSTPIEVIDLEDEPIELTPEKADELTLKALRMFNREPLSSYEISEVAQGMRDRDRPLAAIAEAIHKSESWVSRMLKARLTASPKLMGAWRRGEITDEQFKDLAAQRDAERQEQDTEEVVSARKVGDKTEARSKAKEIVETAKQKKAREKAERARLKQEAKEAKERERQAKKDAKAAKKKGAGVASDKNGAATAAPTWTPPPEAEKPKKPQAAPRVELEEMVALADKRPPTHDYVKGVIAGVRRALGLLEPHEFAKPYAAWIARIGGTAKMKVSPVASPKPKKAALRATAKAKTAKPRGKIVTKKAGTTKAKTKAKRKR